MPEARPVTATQRAYLRDLVSRSEVLACVMEVAAALALPDWYVVAGAITQTVWNDLHGFPLTAHLRDCDLAYFDATDESYTAEDAVIRQVQGRTQDLSVPVEVRNQARVHRWYPERFGRAIAPFRSMTDAIASYPSVATCVGVRSADGQCTVLAPYGLEDLFGMVVQPNPRLVTPAVYREKARRWQAAWPRLKVQPWPETPSTVP